MRGPRMQLSCMKAAFGQLSSRKSGAFPFRTSHSVSWSRRTAAVSYTHLDVYKRQQYLFNTSLLENIRIGRFTATDEEVLEAAAKAQCMEFIEKLPDGIRTMAGDGGKQLSGGQRQRIALARAILKNAPVVVLDEATAFTDPENEEKMEAAISEVVKGKTLLVIAHRLSSVKNADQICVMAEGRIAARGTHDAVSYTHLDVYKRQIFFRSVFDMIFQFPYHRRPQRFIGNLFRYIV